MAAVHSPGAEVFTGMPQLFVRHQLIQDLAYRRNREPGVLGQLGFAQALVAPDQGHDRAAVMLSYPVIVQTG